MNRVTSEQMVDSAYLMFKRACRQHDVAEARAMARELGAEADLFAVSVPIQLSPVEQRQAQYVSARRGRIS
jgi:hypothetical protein